MHSPRKPTSQAHRIRRARPADADAVAELFLRASALHATVAPEFFRAPARERQREDRERERVRGMLAESRRHKIVLVVDLEGAVAGVCCAQIFDTPVDDSMIQRRRAHVETLIVQEPMRRRGCGRALLSAVQSWAKEEGAEQLLLTVWAHNTAASRFYAALGFRNISQVLGTDL
jgi:ribosomal protein S18 acetylase RimI-like enzyme